MKGLTLVILLLCSSLLFAQKTITGKITDRQTGTPLAGASIKLKGTSRGTSSNNEGVFSLQVGTGDILIISIIGYTSQTLPIPESSSFTILLEPASAELTQLIFVGNGGLAGSKPNLPYRWMSSGSTR